VLPATTAAGRHNATWLPDIAVVDPDKIAARSFSLYQRIPA
jgi:hypothetical protein